MSFFIPVAAICSVLFLVSLYFFYFAICRKHFSKKKIGESAHFTPEQAKLVKEGEGWLANQKTKTLVLMDYFYDKMYAELLENKNSKKYIILVHGYRSNTIHNFAGIVKKYYDMGFSILMPDQRAHGRSDGNFITFGYNESIDMYNWGNYLIKLFGRDISIVYNGISMGATTLTMMSGMNLPPNVKGIIADCGFSSAYDIFKHILKKDFGLPAFPILNIASVISDLVADFPFKECSAIEQVKKATVPMLFIHGTADVFVPHWMSIAVYNACNSKEKDLLLIGGAGHGMSYLTDTKTCEERIDTFLNKIL